jgi:primosomal protein N' (replication factor Y)
MAHTSLNQLLFAKVLLPLGLPAPYDYQVPSHMSLTPGDLVWVPLGGKVKVGVVWSVAAATDVPNAKLKQVIEKIPGYRLPESTLSFVQWVSKYTLSPMGAVLKMAISVPSVFESEKTKNLYALASDVDIQGISLTSARQKVIDFLHNHPLSSAFEIIEHTKVTPSVLKGLIKLGLVQERQEIYAETLQNFDVLPGPALSGEQEKAAQGLRQAVDNHTYQTIVLDGITGSGKTEVYFEAIAEALKKGQQSLVLLPEIALSTQWFQRFESRFGFPPVVWHSDLTPAQRRDNWRAVLRGQAKVIVGARSGLFLPFPNLGLIVVDEEHETTFKQESGVLYQARDMAVVRGYITSCPVILSSATPSLETIQNIKEERYEHFQLTSRYGRAQLPEIAAIDMRRVDRKSAKSWISDPLKKEIQLATEKGEQVLLFLNRRGYAPLTLCQACGERLMCPTCASWLVHHKKNDRLFCHHCGFNRSFPEACDHCGEEDTFVACGPGVERIAEEVRILFPHLRVAIMTSDTMDSPKETIKLLDDILHLRVDVIVGTQVMAKGYHFPKLTLVGVIDADLGLLGGDLRASEKTYQLLHQVAGRAGRSEFPGKVFLQTYAPEHPVLQAILEQDREAFLALESESRERHQMPPFGRLAAIIIASTSPEEAEKISKQLARKMPVLPEVEILGPAPAPLALLKGRYRWRFLIKYPKNMAIQSTLKKWVDQIPLPSTTKVQIDIDPYHFL